MSINTSRLNGGIMNKTGYAYNDLTIVPAYISGISSRKECYVYDENGMLPIFTSPMLSVVNEHNMHIWEENKIYPIAPRTIPYMKRIEFLRNRKWVAMSLTEFNKLFVEQNSTVFTPRINNTYKVLIDLANGHMKKLYEMIQDAKVKANEGNYKLIIMTGNIANPETYELLCKYTNVDYVRLSIGTGAGCLTTSNVGVHYPVASLIDECKQIQEKVLKGLKEGYDENEEDKYISAPKIIADGGVRGYADINKALALGADYVMCGSVFAALLESSADMSLISNDQIKYQTYYNKETGEVTYSVAFDEIRKIYIWNGNTEEEKRELIRSVKSITKKYIGMSTKEAQIAVNASLENPIIADKKDLKTSEGCTKMLECKYTIKQWLENMIDYLRSAMSYVDATNIDEFRNNTKLIPNSPYAVASVNK